MKLTPYSSRYFQRNRVSRQSDLQSISLRTDYNFQSTSSDRSGIRAGVRTPSRAPSTWNVSREFFRREVHRHFAEEAMFFAVIVLIAAWLLFSLFKLLSGPIR